MCVERLKMNNKKTNNMLSKKLLPAVILILFTMSCSSKKQYELKDSEKSLCDSILFDYAIIKDLRVHNQNTIESFHYSISKMYDDGKLIEIDPILLPGIVFKENNDNSYKTLFALKDNFREKGYSIFLLENNFNIGGNPDYLAVLKTTDKYQILKQIETNGINYNITTDSLISIIRDFDEKYSLELIGASGDWCEFIIHNKEVDWNQFAQDVYNICPDVVDQGVGTVEELTRTLKESGRLYFWWD